MKNKWGLFSAQKEEIMPPKYDDIRTHAATNGFIVRQGQNYGIIDSVGKLLLPVNFSAVKILAPHVVEVFDGEKWKLALWENGRLRVNQHNVQKKHELNDSLVLYQLKTNSLILVNLRRCKSVVIQASDLLHQVTFQDRSFLCVSRKESENSGRKVSYGLVNMDGSIFLRPEYRSIRAVAPNGKAFSLLSKIKTQNYYFKLNQLMLYRDESREANSARNIVFDAKGNEVISVSNPAIYSFPNYFITSKEGIRYAYLRNGKFLDLVGYDYLRPLGDKYFICSATSNDMYGLIDTSGRVLLADVYTDIILHHSSRFVFTKRRGRWGVANLKGHELLPNRFARNDIQILPSKRKIKAYADSIMFNTLLDKDDNLIDCIEAKRFVRVMQKNNSDANHWVQNANKESDSYLKWGIMSGSKSILLDYMFNQQSEFYDSPRFFLTKNNDKYGIVDLQRAISILPAIQHWIYMADLDTANVFRSITKSGRMSLVAKGMKCYYANCSFIDDPSSPFIRVAQGGGVSIRMSEKYSVQAPGVEWIAQFHEKDKAKKKGYLSVVAAKWIIVGTDGRRIFDEEFDFVERPFRNRIIVAKNKKWGVMGYGGEMLVPYKYTDIKHFRSELDNSQWIESDLYKASQYKNVGVIDAKGNEIIPFLYDDIRLLPNENGNFFAVKKNGLWGLVNSKNDSVIDIAYRNLSYLSATLRNYFRVTSPTIQHGYIDARQKIILLPDGAKPVKNNENLFLYRTSNGAKVCMDDEGKILLKPRRRMTLPSNNRVWFGDGRGKWNLHNMQGDTILKKWVKVKAFSQGLAAVKQNKAKSILWVKQAKRWGYIDKNGNLAIDFEWKTAEAFSKEGFAKVKKGKYWGLIDTSGRIILPAKFRIIEEFSERGFARVCDKSKKWGLLHKSGKLVIEPQYKSISPPVGNRILFQELNKMFGYADTTGYEVIPAQFKDARPFSEGYAVVKPFDKKNKARYYGIINTEGSTIIEAQYNYLSDVVDGLFYEAKTAFSRSDLKWYSVKGEAVDAPVANTILRKSDLVNGVSFYQKHRKVYACVGRDGKRIIPKYYQYVKPISRKLYLVREAKSSKWGFFHVSGAYQNKVMFDYIKLVSNDWFYFQVNKSHKIFNSQGKSIFEQPILSIHQEGERMQLRNLCNIYYFMADGSILSAE